MAVLENLYKFLPGVKKPERRLTFKQKFIWTSSILLTYYVLSQIPIFGMSSATLQYFQTFETILGASIGSLITLGIGPIVTASIILQLLVGSKIIPWDMSQKENQAKFHGLQKLLAFLFVLFEAVAFVSMGAIVPVKGTLDFFLLVVFQICLGGWAIIFMDEVVSKWGFGSGIGLFIVAGVAKRIVVRALSPATLEQGAFAGIIPEFIRGFMTGTPQFFILIPLVMTVIVFLIAVYAQAMRVEIPLTFGNVRGFGRKWPLKFIYTSVLPVILVSALIANIRLLFRMLSSRGVDFVIGNFHLVGDLTTNAPAASNTLIYYFRAPSDFLLHIFTLTVTTPEIIRVITYTLIYTVGAIVFSIFWMKTAGQDPETLADQIHGIGMGVPGFRKDKRIIIKILKRYIPALTVLGGAFIGFLAAFANWTNALGSGTGILLAVMIVFQLYEELAKQHMEDMHPMLRKFFTT